MWLRHMLAYTRTLRGAAPELRSSGKACSSCNNGLPPPHMPGFRQCPRCRPADAYAVYMAFACTRGAWRCRFFDERPDGKLVKEVTFGTPDKLRETAKRGKGLTFAAAKMVIERAITAGEGQVWLQLNHRQYRMAP
jgi:hypothetical protein